MPSLAASLVGLALIAHASAHLSLINIYGSNDVVGHAFGVNLYGKYPRARGEAGDAGGDSGVFETGTDTPFPACGSTPELGPIDLGAWMGQAEGDGLPAAHANMSVVVEAFQVNRDGGGPMSCEYSEDATTTSWKPMFMTLNQAGNSGIQNQLRSNVTVVMNFPPNAKCTGGWTQTACIVRCRTGVNKRFGGCFAVKLSDSTQPSLVTSNSTDSNDTSIVARPVANERFAEGTSTDLSDEQISQIANQVILQMKNDGLIFASSNNSTQTPSIASQPSDTGKCDLSKSRLADPNQSADNIPPPQTPDAGRDQEGNSTSLSDNPDAESNQGDNPDAGSNQDDKPDVGSNQGDNPDAGSNQGDNPDAGSSQGDNQALFPDTSASENPFPENIDATSNQGDSMNPAPNTQDTPSPTTNTPDAENKQAEKFPVGPSPVVPDDTGSNASDASKKQLDTAPNVPAIDTSAIGVSDTDDKPVTNAIPGTSSMTSNISSVDASAETDKKFNIIISNFNHTSRLSHVSNATDASKKHVNTTLNVPAANNSANGVSDTDNKLMTNATSDGSASASNNTTVDASDEADEKFNSSISNSNNTFGLNHSALVSPAAHNQRLVNTTSSSGANLTIATGSHQANNTATAQHNPDASKSAPIVAIHTVDKPLVDATVNASNASVAGNSTVGASDVADNELYKGIQVSIIPLPSKKETSEKHWSRSRISQRKSQK
ncbi:hypothetical protein PtA15_8A106 [Puccinia triticina]|uniref:Uncharacterized protein n=1 Tax=Puccinia triticina TaxID=208348 RepID=A0ABY7CQ94_9BASI|nr:uncharacterized protein PtA15_8A106 [Puccinia triticina]WAQ87205.1 hypothetical protein PtA15_8A106 [Puccinia triticina]